MNDKISIIVPIYNVENYIDRCINSLVNQTYENIEIILVNDGSTDSSGEKCKRWKYDKRIIYLEKKNGGLSDARNYALNYFTGNYICFVDSDDYVENNYVEIMYRNLIQTSSDISCVNYVKIDESGNIGKKVRKVFLKEYKIIEAIKQTLYQNEISNSAWGKLYKAELFNNIRFPYGKLSEDLGTTYKLFYKSTKICASNIQLYYYLQRKNSIMNSKFNLKKLDSLKFALDIYNFAKSNEKRLIFSAKTRICYECVGILKCIGKQEQYNNEKKDVKKILRKNFLLTFFNMRVNFKLKINMILKMVWG